jgi:hypothetical protein
VEKLDIPQGRQKKEIHALFSLKDMRFLHDATSAHDTEFLGLWNA